MDELDVPFAVDGDDDSDVGDEYGDREQRDERALRNAGHGHADRQPVGGLLRVPAATVVEWRSFQHRQLAGTHRAPLVMATRQPWKRNPGVG